MSTQSKFWRAALLVLRVVLGVVFVYAAWTKLWEPWQVFAMAIDAYGVLPLPVVTVVARTLPWFELALGLLLIVGRFLRISTPLVSLLLMVFFGLMIRAYAQGKEINCGCFGLDEVISWKTLLRDGTLLAGSLLLTLVSLRGPPVRRLSMAEPDPQVLARELAYHEKLYSGFAQSHFARPAVRALRLHSARRILELTGAGARSRVLSLGCGIGDTELLLAPHVAEVVGIDLSPAAIRQAREDAARLGIANARFEQGTTAEGRFDAVIAIFFLHHLPDAALAELPGQVRALLPPGGVFYSLDPSRRRLSGAVGRLLIPKLMKRYQTPDERELLPEATLDLFLRGGFDARVETYDFGSTPLAGLLPGWGAGYRAARALDDRLLRWAPLRRRGSNFEIVAR